MEFFGPNFFESKTRKYCIHCKSFPPLCESNHCLKSFFVASKAVPFDHPVILNDEANSPAKAIIKKRLEWVLKHGFSKPKIAKLLGVHKCTIYNYLKKSAISADS